MIQYACIKIDVTLEYLKDTRKSMLEAIERIKNVSGEDYEARNLNLMVEFVETAITLLLKLRTSLCSSKSPAIASTLLDKLYMHAITGHGPIPSQVRAVLIDLYMALRDVVSSRQR